MWWITLWALRLLPKRESSMLIFQSIIANIYIPFHFTLFHFKPTLKVSDWMEFVAFPFIWLWAADTHHRSLCRALGPNERRLKERYWSTAAQIIKSIHYASLRPPALDFDVTPWSERRMRESSFLLSKRSMTALTKPRCPSNPPEQAFPSSDTVLVAHKYVLVLSQKLKVLSLFTYPCVVPNPCDVSSHEHNMRMFDESSCSSFIWKILFLTSTRFIYMHSNIRKIVFLLNLIVY